MPPTTNHRDTWLSKTKVYLVVVLSQEQKHQWLSQLSVHEVRALSRNAYGTGLQMATSKDHPIVLASITWRAPLCHRTIAAHVKPDPGASIL